MNTRRSFLYKGMLGVAATALANTNSVLAAGSSYTTAAPAKEDTFKLAIAGYSFVNFNLTESLKMMKKVDAHYLCIKDFHLPYKSTAEEITAFHATLKESGVTGYAVGPIYTKTKKDIDNAFDYAKRVGVDLIIGIPLHDDLAYVAEKQRNTTFGMRFTITDRRMSSTQQQKASTTSSKTWIQEWAFVLIWATMPVQAKIQ